MILPGEARRSIEFYADTFGMPQLLPLTLFISFAISYSGEEMLLDNKEDFNTKVDYLFNPLIERKFGSIKYDDASEYSTALKDMNDASKAAYIGSLDRLKQQLKFTDLTAESLIMHHFIEHCSNVIDDKKIYIETLDTILSYFLKEEAVSKIVKIYEKFDDFEEYKMKKQTEFLDEKLKNIIGLTNIKKELKSLQNLAYISKKRAKENLKSTQISMHMVFTGNPGTGKTTVARIISEIYYNLGLITKKEVFEVAREDLVAGYLGQSENKTREVLENAKGGVLFIDEAYSLTEDDDNYGSTVVNTILKFMEDNRDNTVIIVAGYPKQMRKFIKSNPGLESRFNKFLEFENYDSKELLEILKVFITDNDYEIADADLKKVLKIFDEIDKESENFSNARFVRNLFEKATTNQADRLAEINSYTDQDLKILKFEDFIKN